MYTKEDFVRDVMSRYTPEQRMEGLTIEERLQGLTVEQRLKGLTLRQRLEGLTREERLAALTSAGIMSQLPEEQLELFREVIKILLPSYEPR